MLRIIVIMSKNYDYTHIFDGVYASVTEYNPLPMTEQLFWSRVGWLQQAMIRAENFEFRLLWFNKLQELKEQYSIETTFEEVKELENKS